MTTLELLQKYINSIPGYENVTIESYDLEEFGNGVITLFYTNERNMWVKINVLEYLTFITTSHDTVKEG